MGTEKKGFSIIEMVLGLALFALVVAIGVPISLNAYLNYLLTSEVRNYVSIVRRAQSFSFTNTSGVPHGVAFLDDRLVLFKGTSYATRNPLYDEIYYKSGGVSVSSTPEIVFSSISGIPNLSGTSTFSNSQRTHSVYVNPQGTIYW